MSDARKCDRCGVYFNPSDETEVKVNKRVVDGIKLGDRHCGQHYDLCGDCVEKILEFMCIAPDPKPFENQEQKNNLKRTIRPRAINSVIQVIYMLGTDPIRYLLCPQNTSNLTFSEKKILIDIYDPMHEWLVMDCETETIVSVLAGR